MIQKIKPQISPQISTKPLPLHIQNAAQGETDYVEYKGHRIMRVLFNSDAKSKWENKFLDTLVLTPSQLLLLSLV